MADQIVNVEVSMIRRDLRRLPGFELPAGYSLRFFRPGDAQTWTRIQLDAEKHLTIAPELFAKEFGEDPGPLGERQLFLCAADGMEIGTATAWFNDYNGLPYGRVHWLAIVPGYQGKGLAKPLLSGVLARMKELGHRRAYLVTSTARIPALALYLKFGFAPEVKSEEELAGWLAVRERIGHRALENLKIGKER